MISEQMIINIPTNKSAKILKRKTNVDIFDIVDNLV